MKATRPTFGLLLLLLASLVQAAPSEPAPEGLVKPLREATLSLAISGRISAIPVEPGQVVEAGQLILKLDDRLEALEVERRALILEDRSELELAQERAEILQAAYANTKELYDTAQSITRDDLNQKRLEAAFAASELTKLELREKTEAIEHSMAIDQLARRHVTAPFDGIVTDIMVDTGEVNQSGRPLAHLVDTRICHLELYLMPADALKWKVGQPVRVHADLGGEIREAAAKVVYHSPVIDSASGLRLLRVRFDNSEAAIPPGITAKLLPAKPPSP